MFLFDSSQLQGTLEQSVHTRTGRKIRHLSIEIRPERIVLKGQATTYYVKQLAQHAVRDILPHVPLANAIAVEARLNEIVPEASL